MKSLFIFLSLISSSLFAQQIKLAPNTKWSGTVPATKVTIIVDNAGAITVIVDPATPITITSPNTSPLPPPTTGPTLFEKTVSNLTDQAIKSGGTPTTGAAISSVFTMAADAVQAGNLKPEKSLQAVGSGLRLIMNRVPDKDKWAAFRQTLGDALDTLEQDGSLKNAQDYINLFREVARGMDAITGFNGSTLRPAQIENPNAGIFDKIDLAQLIALIKLLLELFKTFS